MKKIVLSMFIIGLLSSSAFPFKLGLEFQAGEQMIAGANMRITDFFELKPQIGFLFGGDDNGIFDLIVSGNFYLSDMGKLQQYVGPGINLEFTSGDNLFGLDGHYGLRYDINDQVSIFGQVGLGMFFTPDFSIFTHSTGVGLTFFIINK